MRFVKYHGLGNDFIVLEPQHAVTPGLARRLCARGFSIGADGVMRVMPPRTAEADVTMDLVNSDGSLPEMCGNGIRCLVKHAVDVLGFTRNPLRVDTAAGTLACHWAPDAAGKVAAVKVAMGRPRFLEAEIPLDPRHVRPVGQGLVGLEVEGRELAGLPVNTGNPHFVIFGDASRETALACGPHLELHPAFPLKANIEFAEVIDRGDGAADPLLRVTVWERGCGLTLACGTGATASASAAVRLGLVVAGRPVRVELPGGTLVIEVAPDLAEATMEGPVELAFWGEVPE
jgi:diaminopimelate epimerase